MFILLYFALSVHCFPMAYDRIGPVRLMHGALIDPHVSLLVNFKVFYLSRNCVP